LVSDRDEAYRVDNRTGLTVLRPEQDFSLVGHLSELQKMGCGRFVVDLAHLSATSAEGRRVLAAYGQDSTLSGNKDAMKVLETSLLLNAVICIQFIALF